MELNLRITESSNIEEFQDAIGIDLVIPVTGIAICGIFVWGQSNADLRIYETSLLRVNARLYIKVLQIAVDLADLLYQKEARTITDVRRVLEIAAKKPDKIKLIVD